MQHARWAAEDHVVYDMHHEDCGCGECLAAGRELEDRCIDCHAPVGDGTCTACIEERAARSLVTRAGRLMFDRAGAFYGWEVAYRCGHVELFVHPDVHVDVSKCCTNCRTAHTFDVAAE